ncbi:pseudaminic acid cytidylyltransferase [Sphingobacterium corticibacterium]|uniref:Pseudaminic acid cytidylyltransferase n=1 Tax=Sphingobacterium corticibacterium TaxID=2484746 RepID=A0A4Q6XTU8_9SPHI|nr:pseudaminic acid cytidylyltransferase [Sphingobacterium corticibacterium]RZF60239.1 pseudaminic acid cytidylyltransferase [Sphingobacterium corticibacterium]
MPQYQDITNKCVAIIAARGGSKRIPGKNIRKFLDVPLIGYSITAALEAGVFDEVMVSTDNAEIAQMAVSLGAKVPFLRSPATSHDQATTYSVVEEVLMCYGERKQLFTYGCCIYPGPFVNAIKIREGYRKLYNSTADALVPIVRFSYPVLRSLTIENGLLTMAWPKYLNERSQDLPVFYHDCGQFYFFRTQALLRQKKLFLDSTIPFEIPESEVHDIDNEEDWKIAELKYKLLLTGQSTD